ncbi:AraC family transcriptional regulator, partial [Bacillus thuringiensis]
MPIQSFVKLNINKEGEFKMNISRKLEVEQLRNKNSELFD